MKHVNVNSDNVKSIAYDPVGHVLEVKFHSGPIYRYYEVPSQEHKMFLASPSRGQYLHYNIKDSYRSERVK